MKYVPFTVPRRGYAHSSSARRRDMFAPMNAAHIDRTLYDHRVCALAAAERARTQASASTTAAGGDSLDSAYGTLNLSLHYDVALSLLNVRLLAASNLKW